MKRFFTYCMVVVAFATILVSCAGEKKQGANGASDYTSAVSNDAIATVRLDAMQVLHKSGLYDMLMQQLKAAADSEVPEPLKPMVNSILSDLRNTGVDIEAPMYGYVEMVTNDDAFIGIVAKMHSKSKFEAIIAQLEKASHKEMPLQNIDGCTFLFYDPAENVALAYNDTAIMFGVMTDETSPVGRIVKALNAAADGEPTNALPAYPGSDAAICVNIGPAIELAKKTSDIERFDSYLNVNDLRNMKVNIAFNFAMGSIDLDLSVEGAPNSEYKPQPCSNANLTYVPASAWAVANLPLNGGALMDALNKLVNSNKEIKQAVDEEIREATDGGMNYSTIMAFVEPLVRTVNGDATVALNKLNIQRNMRFEYNAYTEQYETIEDKEIKVDASAMVSVTNRTIFDLIEGNLLSKHPDMTRINDSCYTFNVDGYSGYIGQQENLLFASMPYAISRANNPISNAAWYNDVQGSYGFIVLNIDAILSSPAISEKLNEELNDLEYPARSWVHQFKSQLNYLLLNAHAPEELKLKLALKNKKKNSLEQIVDIVKFDILTKLSSK